jgi:glucoamylase
LSEPLPAWIARQYRASIPLMLRSVSPVALVKHRPGFGQTVTARRGAIIASPVLADWDPEPDYFFHWYRDSALVIDALRVLAQDGSLAQDEALAHLRDFVAFSLALTHLQGRALAEDGARIERTRSDFRQFLRTDEELAPIHGEAVAADTRVNPDGTLDLTRWARPQHDGPALRACVLLRWMEQPALDPALREACTALLRHDLAFIQHRARLPSYDIWEEELGLHYYTLRVCAAALRAGAQWHARSGEPVAARPLQASAAALLDLLDGYWLAEAGHYRSRGLLASGARSKKELDIAVILAAVHVQDRDPRHGFADARLHATLAQLEALFAARYPINRHRERGFAMGRYDGDVYHAGGAYYFSTLGAAEFCFGVAALGGDDAAQWFARGDATLAMLRDYVPEDGALSEQFDQRTGAPSSARHLAWSYAAFITCIAARRRAGFDERRAA